MNVQDGGGGATRRDCKRNVDIMNTQNIDRDIVELLQTRSLTYSGNVSRMQPDIYSSVMDSLMGVVLKEDHGSSGRTI